MVKGLHQLGFSAIEIGTVTHLPQEGNPQPRLFRLPKDQALINRMGFNNGGAHAVARRLPVEGVVLGGNIGKSKVVPLEQARDDYQQTFHALHPHVQYFVVNVSSPNTPNLRKLQDKAPLTELIMALQSINRPKKPILLKIAPDLTDPQLDDIVEVVQATDMDGVIATNTTIERSGLKTDAHRIEAIGAGGLSGAPVRQRSTEVIRLLRAQLPNTIDVVGVGGIFTGEDAYEKICAGANVVQIYTGFIYRGPATVIKILNELETCLKRDGHTSLRQAVGSRTQAL